MIVYQDSYYYALVGLAEKHRTTEPPDIMNTVRCLLAIFEFRPPPGVKARLHSQLGSLYLNHSGRMDLARFHLREAIQLARKSRSFEDILADASCSLANAYSQSNDWNSCKQVLSEALEIMYRGSGMMCWMSRIVLQLVDVLSVNREYQLAVDVLRKGYEYALREGCAYLQIIFLLNISQMLMLESKVAELRVHLEKAAHCIDAWQVESAKKMPLRAWFLFIQTMHHILCGDCKSARPCLRNLQQMIISADEAAALPTQPFEFFRWMPAGHLCIAVYALTVLQAMLCGKFEKCRQYSSMALRQLEKLNRLRGDRLLANLRVVLLQCSVIANLGTCNYSTAAREIVLYKSIVESDSQVQSIHAATLKLLVGLYAVAMDQHDQAERSFTAVVSSTKNAQLSVFTNLQLAVLYLYRGRQSDFYALMGIGPDRMRDQSIPVKVCSLFVRSVHLVMQARYAEAKKTLCDALELASRHDLNRLVSLCLALTGQMLLLMNCRVAYHQECQRVLESASQIAVANRDLYGQAWVLACLRNLSALTGDGQEEERRNCAAEIVRFLCEEKERCCQLTEHQMIMDMANEHVQNRS